MGKNLSIFKLLTLATIRIVLLTSQVITVNNDSIRIMSVNYLAAGKKYYSLIVDSAVNKEIST
jgi:hypothetical protein